MATGQYTIYLVDDDPEVCHSLRLFLDNQGYRTKVFHSAECLLDIIDRSEFGVLVLDYCLNGLSGLELQSELTRRDIDWPVIFISGRGDVKTSVTALKKGAVDFLVKPFEGKELLDSIEEALLAANSAHKQRIHRHEIETRCRVLTAREKEVMEYVAAGVSNKNLAKHLGVSTRTVEAHRSRMMKKMTASSLPELVCMVDQCSICQLRKLPPEHPATPTASLQSIGVIERNISKRICVADEDEQLQPGTKTASKR